MGRNQTLNGESGWMNDNGGNGSGRHCGNCMHYSDDGRWRRCGHEDNTGTDGWPSYVPSVDETCEKWTTADKVLETEDGSDS